MLDDGSTVEMGGGNVAAAGADTGGGGVGSVEWLLPTRSPTFGTGADAGGGGLTGAGETATTSATGGRS